MDLIVDDIAVPRGFSGFHCGLTLELTGELKGLGAGSGQALHRILIIR